MPRGRTRSNVCRECGQPRSPKARMALCEEHLRAYWRERDQAQRKKKTAKKAAAKAPLPAPPDVGELGALPAGKPVIAVSSRRVSMTGEVFGRLTRPPAQPAAALTRQLAVVSSDLERVLIYEARPREMHHLSGDNERYARQMAALREAGYIICVEE